MAVEGYTPHDDVETPTLRNKEGIKVPENTLGKSTLTRNG